MGSSVDSKNANRLKNIKLVGVLADGEVWEFEASSGTMIPGTTGGGAGSNLYTADGTLTGARTITGGANRLKFITNSGTLGFKVERQGFPSEFVEIGGTNITVGASKIGGDTANPSYLNGNGASTKFGIGIAAPLYHVHCKTASDSTQGVRVEGVSSGTYGFLRPAGLILNDGSTNVDLRSFPGSASYIIGNLSIGQSAAAGAKLHVKGTGATSGTTALLVENSAGTDLLEVKDDGTIIGNFPVDGNGIFDGSGAIPASAQTIIDVGAGGSTLGIRSTSAATCRLNFYIPSLTAIRAGIGLDAGNQFIVETANAFFMTNVLGHQFKTQDSSSTTAAFRLENSSSERIIEARADGRVLIGNTTSNPVAKLQVRGEGATSGTTALLVENSAGTDILVCRDDSAIGMYGATPVVQATTGGASAIISTGVGVASKQDDTYGGYTMAQVVQALQNLGALA